MSEPKRRRSRPRILRSEVPRTGELLAFSPDTLEDFEGSARARAIRSQMQGTPGSSDDPPSPNDDPEEAGEVLRQIDRWKQEALEAGRREAEQLVATARERAIQMLEEAKREAEELKRQAAEAGHQEGIEEGRREGRAQIEAQCQALEALVRELAERFAAEQRVWFEALEKEMLALSFALAKKIAGWEIETRPDAVLPIARQAIELVRGGQEVTLWISREDAALVRERRPELLDALDGTSSLRIQVGENLQHGECVVETDREIVDATFAERLRLAEQYLARIEDTPEDVSAPGS